MTASAQVLKPTPSPSHLHASVPTADDSNVPSNDELEASRVVLDWVRTDEQPFTKIQDVPGATEAQATYLTRLSALILAEVDAALVRPQLLSTLHPAAHLFIPATVRDSFRQLLKSDPVSSLATIYAQTVSAPNRRALGTFFTPRLEAASMVQEYAQRFAAPASVVDIGAGVGVFSEAASIQWPNASISAIDVNPVTLGLQAVALASSRTSNITLFLDDYASWLKKSRSEGPTLYLGNPPYTRWQLIPPDQRDALIAATDNLVESRANLSTLFLAMTLRKLRRDDSLCLIVPAGWMSALYARALRAYVRSQHLRPVTLRLADSWRFDNAIVDAVVVQIGPESTSKQPLLTTDWPGKLVVETDRDSSGDQAPFARLSKGLPISSDAAKSAHIRLGDIATITRGTATGANSFFLLSASNAAERGIDARWLTPIVRRLRPGDTPAAPAAEPSSILNLGDFSPGDDPHVDKAIAEAEAHGVHQGHLCKLRRRWFDLSSELQQPDVILSALSRDRFHIYLNESKCGITNNLFGLRWQRDLSDEQKASVLSWLRSESGQAALVDSASNEANGLRRLSPRALGDVLIPLTVGRDSLGPYTHATTMKTQGRRR